MARIEDLQVNYDLVQALTELDQLKKDRRKVDSLADKIHKYIDANHFADNLVDEILRYKR